VLKIDYTNNNISLDSKIISDLVFKLICLYLSRGEEENVKKLNEKFSEENQKYFLDTMEGKFLTEAIKCYNEANEEKFKEEW